MRRPAGRPPVARFDATSWFGLLAPAGTPAEIVGRVHQDIVRTLQSMEMQGKFANNGATPVGNTSISSRR